MIDTWDEGHKPDARAFLRLHPEMISRREVVIELAYEEYCYRLEQGMKPPAPQVFAVDFPACKSSLCKLLVAHRFASDNPELLKNDEEIPWPQLDETFLGFKLQQELGRGAFARVFLASETALGGRLVVVKVSSKFGQVEAEILGKLNHENIVPIHSIQQDATTKLTAACMPYLGRATLCEVLDWAFLESKYPNSARLILEASTGDRRENRRQQGSRPDRILEDGSYVEGIIHLGAQIARALASVHSQQIFHRDLKPSNVLLTPAGRPMLLDFNLSFDEQGKEHFLGGTLPYMAPEQLAALSAPKEGPRPVVDGQADLYALGVILFELLAGRHPFGPIPWDLTKEELAQFFAEKQASPLPSLREALPAGPTEKKVASVIERCLAHDPKDRYASATELEAALRHCLPRMGRIGRWMNRHRRLTSTLLGSLIGLTLIAGAGISLREPYAERMYKEGVKAYYADDAVRAVDCFSQALLAKADPIRTLFARARANQKIVELHQEPAKWHRVQEDLDTLDKLDPGQHGRTMALMAYYYHRKPHPDYTGAAICYQIALNHGFVNAAVLNNLGFCSMYRHGKIDEVAGYLHESIRLDPNRQAPYFNLVVSQMKLAEFNPRFIPEVGIEAAKQASQMGPSDSELYHCTARLYAYLARRKKNLGPDEWQQLEALLFHNLRSAIDLGYNPAVIEKDLLFVTWRGDPQFQELVKLPAGPPGLFHPERVIDPIQGLGE